MKKENLHKSNSGFKVPEDYFERFEQELSKKIPSFQSNSPLKKINKDSGFRTPDHYFETLTEDIVNQTSNPKTKKQKVIPLFNQRKILLYSGIAAMIAIIISISISQKSKFDFDDIEIADIQAYFNEDNIELNDSEIAALLGDDLDLIDAFDQEFATEEVVLDYLSEEDIEDTIIFEE